ncbi:MAG: sulfatase-like hydrolase/transferase [Proteobacteria bacterium]|nr:sulfatase-like hydrolase/transferase [Pseudomonadota bacterium]MCP4915507.1 sulfatase-like hydrolase/transferase [Pseudomonadota bacterium]
MWTLLLLSCRPAATPDSPKDSPVVESKPDSPGDSPTESKSDSDKPTTGKTVVWFTIDTMNEDGLGLNQEVWDTSPNHDLVYTESVVLTNTVVTRGVTVVSIPSMATGTYPRTHGVHDTSVPETMPTMVHEAFQAAGYTTHSYSSNFCEVVQSRGMDKSLCTSPEVLTEHAGDEERDQALVDKFLLDLADLEDDESAFFWLHLRDPHSDHTPRNPWATDFYGSVPDDQSPIQTSELTDIMLGDAEKPEDFDAWLAAVYASQVRSADEMLGTVRTALVEANRWDEAVVVTGTDHGEELGEQHDFYFHGCSFYDGVMNTTYSVKAPSITPGLFDNHVSSIDIMPTVLEAAGVEIPETVEGRSLVSYANGAEWVDRPNFFERGQESAGVVVGGRKYFFHAEEGQYRKCNPYQNLPGAVWDGPNEALFDLIADPGEAENLIGIQSDPSEKQMVCEWVTEKTWITTEMDRSNDLVLYCRDYLGIGG